MSEDFIVHAWGQGHEYTPNSSPSNFLGTLTPIPKPGSLLNGTKYYERSKPNYNGVPASGLYSVRDGGAKGDGVTDDTAALQSTLDSASSNGKIVFFDYGIYKVTKTLSVPPNCKLVGESYSMIISNGPFFADMKAPQPVVRVGQTGQTGIVEWSDMVVGTQGAQAGAVLIEWNVASDPSNPSGMWDVHTRIGGFAGSNLQLADCPATTDGTTAGTSNITKRDDSYSSPLALKSNRTTQSFWGLSTNSTGNNTENVKQSCIGAYTSLHITKSATALYMENVWLWTADHDLDSVFTNISVYSGRGMYIESEKGNIWLVGTAVEHHALYQYQLANTQNIFMGQIQTETAYYQPSPDIGSPFPPVAADNDPQGSQLCDSTKGNCDGWGLRIINSHDISVYGAGLYSFFNNYNTSCSDAGNGETCQQSIFSIESSHNINVYNLNTVGATSMIDQDGKSLASYSDNVDVFPDTIAIFRSG